MGNAPKYGAAEGEGNAGDALAVAPREVEDFAQAVSAMSKRTATIRRVIAVKIVDKRWIFRLKAWIRRNYCGYPASNTDAALHGNFCRATLGGLRFTVKAD